MHLYLNCKNSTQSLLRGVVGVVKKHRSHQKHCEYCVGGAKITARGNIKLGNLTVQRKGGDVGKKTAQMLQFKFSPRGMFDMQNVGVIEKI